MIRDYLLNDKNALLGDTAETPMVQIRAEIFIASMACVAYVKVVGCRIRIYEPLLE